MLLLIAIFAFFSFSVTSTDTTQLLLSNAQAAYQNRNMPQAINLYKQTLVHDRETMEAFFKLGTALAQQQQYEQALPYFTIITKLDPKQWDAHFYRGTCLSNMQQYKQAAQAYQQALQYNPNASSVYLQLSDALSHLHHFDAALTNIDTALSLQPTSAQAHVQKALIYHERGNIDNAITWYQKALNIEPNSAEIVHGLAYMYRLKGDMPKAIEQLEKELKLRPNYPLAHIALSHAHWVLGNFDTVWREREWRWKAKGFDPAKQKTPLWDGSDLTGKTILLYAENGFGDTMQFIRFAQELKNRGAKKIICEVQKPLIPLLRMCQFIDSVTSGNLGRLLADSSIDYQAPLMSVPRMLNIDEKNIPNKPYLQADEKLTAQWRKKLSHKKLKVGLCWHVEKKHEATASPLCKRAIQLEHFAPLAQLENIQLYSLQKYHDEQELKQWQSKLGLKTFGPGFDTKNGAFMDTAAVIANLDLVITVDTSIAHLAGALGKPVWVLLPTSPDCRWQLERTDSPWYPSMKLFRSSLRPGLLLSSDSVTKGYGEQASDWSSVIKSVKEKLSLLEKHS